MLHAAQPQAARAMKPAFLLYRVRGDSMLPALHSGDYVLARTSAASGVSIARGSILVVTGREQVQIKRVIGLPGERVTLAEGTLYVGGERLVEPYLHGLPPYLGLGSTEYELEGDEYFVMGDNRTHSTDSRHYGPVKRVQIEGRVMLRVWPPLRFGKP